MDFMFWIWLAVIVITVIIELTTMELVSVWFTAGAIIPFILSAVGVCGWDIQVIIFVIISIALVLSLRKITKKFLFRNSKGKTNLETLIGQEVRMLEATDFDTIGAVKVNGLVWSAVSEDGKTEIPVGEIVKIVKVKGNKLLVKKVEKIEGEGEKL